MIYSHYPAIHNLGHPLIADLFADPVLIEEKIDGSQFNWWLDDENILHFRSKGTEIYPETADKLFKPAITKVLEIKDKLKPGLFYRGETLCKPKHNTLAYARVPKGNIILFDIDDGNGNFFTYPEKAKEATRLGLETVPLIDQVEANQIQDLGAYAQETLLRGSILEGTPIEGMVFKNYKRFGRDGKPLFGKYVSEKFKESHKKNWKEVNPGSNDIILNLTEIYRHDNRWVKAIQHLQEKGELVNDPKDIGKLMKEIQEDVKKEEYENIVQLLWKWAWPKLSRGIIRGFPEFYKKLLLEKQKT